MPNKAIDFNRLDDIKRWLWATFKPGTASANISDGVTTARPYRSYVARLTQTGTAAPVATVLENQLGASAPTLARTGAGVYTLTLNNAFTVAKTIINVSPPSVTGVVSAVLTSVSVITINTGLLLTGVATDALLTNTLVEVRVYN